MFPAHLGTMPGESVGWDEHNLISHRVYDSLRGVDLWFTNQGDLGCGMGTFCMLDEHM